MSANPKFLAATAQVDEAAVQPLPKSRKIYIEGSRADIRVPMREIAQSETSASFGTEANPPITVYDTSGPYTDPSVTIDIRSGLAPLRARWITERADIEELAGPSSRFGVDRLNDPKLAELRFNLHRRPRRAQAGHQRHADALRAARHCHARDGVHRDSREPAGRRAAALCCGVSIRANRSAHRCRNRSHPSSSATKSRAAARSFRPTSIIRKPSR